jgi:hypothetical protein
MREAVLVVAGAGVVEEAGVAGVAGESGEAGVDVVGGVGAPSLELLLDPQPLIAKIKTINVSGANTARAFDPCTIATCS